MRTRLFTSHFLHLVVHLLQKQKYAYIYIYIYIIHIYVCVYVYIKYIYIYIYIYIYMCYIYVSFMAIHNFFLYLIDVLGTLKIPYFWCSHEFVLIFGNKFSCTQGKWVLCYGIFRPQHFIWQARLKDQCSKICHNLKSISHPH